MSQVSTILVYGKPNCVQCKATVRALEKADADYDYLDVSTDSALFDYLASQGVSQMPFVEVVEAQDGEGVVVDSWSGFNPDKIKEYV